MENEIDTDNVTKAKLPPLDGSYFAPLTLDDLIEVLGITIKKDETNKLITFLSQLSAYTENSQINISFNAPSSSGKSFIPLEIVQLFPKEDVIKLGTCSPTAFFHEQGVYDKENNVIRIDLSRKILIFLDQPSNALLERLRAILSHDEKEITAKITDKNQKGGNRTKTVIIKGFPAVIFCTAGLRMDEQEATRFLLLSPEINQEKIREAIYEKIKKETDPSQYNQDIEDNPKRIQLKERILAIRNEHITDIHIGNSDLVKKLFFERVSMLKPRHSRDVGRLTGFVKVLALLNLWHREQVEGSIIATEEDIRAAFSLWDTISESQELNLPPYVYNLYTEVILSAFNEKNSELNDGVKIGLTRSEIMQKHYKVYGRYLPDWQLRQQIIPPLETSGLLTQDSDQLDKRKMLIYPTVLLTTSKDQNNSELGSGVVTGNEAPV